MTQIQPYGSPTSVSLDALAGTSPAQLNELWRHNVLPWAVEQLLASSCFNNPLLARAHAGCHTMWERAAGDPDRYLNYYCRSAPSVCANCNHEWYGVGVRSLKDEPKLHILRGQIVSNRCPACLTPHQVEILQQTTWWRMLATLIAKETHTLAESIETVTADWTARLADIILRARLVTFQPDGNISAYYRLAADVRAELMEMGLIREGPDGEVKLPDQYYQLVNFAVYAEPGFKQLGIANWRADVQGWSVNAKRAWASILQRATIEALDGKEPLPAAEVAAALAEPNPVNQAKALRNKLQPPPPPAAIRWPTYVLNVHDETGQLDHAWLVVKLTGERSLADALLRLGYTPDGAHNYEHDKDPLEGL